MCSCASHHLLNFSRPDPCQFVRRKPQMRMRWLCMLCSSSSVHCPIPKASDVGTLMIGFQGGKGASGTALSSLAVFNVRGSRRKAGTQCLVKAMRTLAPSRDLFGNFIIHCRAFLFDSASMQLEGRDPETRVSSAVAVSRSGLGTHASHASCKMTSRWRLNDGAAKTFPRSVRDGTARSGQGGMLLHM